MNQRQRPLSAAIEALPETFALDTLVAEAQRLLPPSAGDGAITAQQIGLYVEQKLVDPPAHEAPAYRQRHLLQVVAIHSLRDLNLSIDRIRELVQGVDDGYLRMLCDEPVEAEKKAAVMSNWLKMLSNGRVGRPERGETHMLHAPEAEPAPQPERPVAPVRNRGGLAPPLEMIPPPPPRQQRSPTFPAAAAADRGAALPGDLPSDLPGDLPSDLPNSPSPRPPSVPWPRQVQPRTREVRAARPTMAATDAIVDALHQEIAVPGLDATPQVAVRVPVIEPAGVGREAQQEAPTALAPALPQAWTRARLADGVELHLRVGHARLATEDVDALIAEIRGLIGD